MADEVMLLKEALCAYVVAGRKMYLSKPECILRVV